MSGNSTAEPDASSVDDDVRVAVYRSFAERARPPVPAEIAAELGVGQRAIEVSLRRLAAAHVLVLAPGTPYVWMANPFSAIPTPFRVETTGAAYFGNCIWDALGILAALGTDGRVETWCPDCGDAESVSVEDGEVRRGDGVVHYGVAAARWWDDIGFN